MRGCSWQEKSFTVYSNERPVATCEKCGKEIFGVTYKINGNVLCRDCFGNTPCSIKSLDVGDNFQTTKDQLWNFVDIMNFEKPIQISSKRQWENECKKRGLIYRTHNDTTQPKKFEKVSLEEKKNLIREDMKRQGLYDANKLFKRR